MGYESTAELLALHGVRLKGFAATEVVADVTGLPEPDVDTVLRGAEEAGRAVLRSGAISGWSLTPDGRAHHRRLLTDEADAAGYRDDVAGAYERFLPLNEPFKALCTTWQMEGQPATCVEQLVALQAALLPVLDELSAAAARFSRYGDRFDVAIERLRAGDADAFTKPLCGSYHDVWMELHEDLLLTLERERSAADGH